MPVWVARTVPRWTVGGAPVCHDGRCMPPHTSGYAAPHHVPLGEPQSDAWAGKLERRPEVVTCRGKWFAAAAVLPRLRACRSSGLAGVRGAPRRASVGVPWLAFPASSTRRGLGASAWSSRQAPLAAVLSPRPGKLLLPGPRLLGSSTWSSFGPERAVEVLGVPLASLATGCYYCPCTSSGY